MRAGCELTGAVDPAHVVRLPAHDVLPFENLSPHPDVQEQRASALWKLATGAVSILIAPVESAALKLFDRDYYAGLAVTLKRGEEVDLEVLTAHLASVGYTQVDLVEMPGQFTRRGGILDVYSPEADRPVRIEFFGDEIETIRKFDPETQRSQSGARRGATAAVDRDAGDRAPAGRGAWAAEPAAGRYEGDAKRGRKRADGRRGCRGRRSERLSRMGVFRFGGRGGKITAARWCPNARSSSKSRRWCATRSIAGGTRSSSGMSGRRSAR